MYVDIDKNGIVFLNSTDGKEYEFHLSELLIRTYYGIIELPFHYKYNKIDVDMLEKDSVGYRIVDLIIINSDNIQIKEFIFRRVQKTHYFISNSGIVYNSLTNRIKSYYYDSTMYQCCYLGIGNPTIHYAVYLTWGDKIPINYTIDHIDGHKYNNNINNLEAVSFIENVKRSFITNLRHSDWALHIDTICRLMESKKSIEEIAKIIGYSAKEELHSSELQLLLTGIANGTHWRSVSDNYNIDKDIYNIKGYRPRHKLSTLQIEYALNRYSRGATQKEIASEMSINRKRLNSILYDTTSHIEIRSKYSYENIYRRPLISKEHAHEIFKMISDGKDAREIINRFNDPDIDELLVARMRAGKAYKNIHRQYSFENITKRNKLTDEDVHNICKKLESKMYSISIIAKEFNVGFHAISGINNGETRKDISAQYKLKYNSI